MVEAYPPSVEAWVSLKKVHFLLSRRLQHEYARLHLTATQYMVLRDLSAGPGQASTLAASLGVTTANLTGVIDRLEAAGLIERDRRQADRRTVRLALTAKGRVLTGEAMSTLRGSVQSLFATLDPDDLDALQGGLDKLLEALELDEPLGVSA